MRSFYTDSLGFTADLCKHLYRESTHLTVRTPEGHCIYTHWHATWEDALATLRYMLPSAVNDLTHQPLRPLDTHDTMNQTTEKVKEEPTMKKVTDGWHNIAGYRVYVESGKILRGIIGSDNAQRTAYPYRYNRKTRVMDECTGITVDAFRAGVKRGTVTME